MRTSIRSLLVSALITSAGMAGEIVLPSNSFERDSVMDAAYRTSGLATGTGQLAITWTDAHGRLVDDRKIPVTLTDEDRIVFPLDLRRAAKGFVGA